MSTHRLRFSTAAITVAVLGLTACGGGATASSGDVELRFAWWGSDSRHTQTQEIIDAFEAQNPGVKVTGEYGDFGGYWDKLATQTASNDAPDIIQMDEKYLREYADNGALMDLSGMDFSEIDDDVIKSGETEEGLFGIATGINALAMMTNPDIIAEAGLEMPDDTTWTWEDFAELSREIFETTDAYGTGSPNEPGMFQIWLRQNGRELTNTDGSLGFETADAAAYFATLLDMTETGALPPASVVTEDQSPGPDQSLTGRGEAAMGMWWSNQLAALSTASGADLVPLRVPSIAGSADQAHLFHKSAMYMSGSARTDHPDEVQAFIDFMVNSEEAGLINLADRGLPANATVREAVLPELSETDARAAEYIDEIEPELGAAMPVPPLGFSALQEILYRYQLDVLFERSTPEDAAERAFSEMESAIS